jgi:hypothetical protein
MDPTPREVLRDPFESERWIGLAQQTWRKVAIARTRPEHAEEAWPTELTGGAPIAEGEVIFLHLLAVGRSAFGVELAYQRLFESRSDYDAAAIGPDLRPAEIESSLRMSSELHALFVYADSFWDNLRSVRRALPGIAGLRTVCDSNATKALVAATARNHVEHFAERISDGRPKGRTAPAMSAEVFRQGAGGFDGRWAYFGDEEFDVVELHDVIVAAQMEALNALEERL